MVAEVQDIFLRKRNTTAKYKRKKNEAGEIEKKKTQPAKNDEEIFKKLFAYRYGASALTREITFTMHGFTRSIILSAQSIIKLIFMKRITWFLNCEIILRECSMPGFDNSLTIKF